MLVAKMLFFHTQPAFDAVVRGFSS